LFLLGVGEEDYFLSLALTLSLSIAAMMATNSLHPPAGATALLAVFGGKRIMCRMLYTCNT
jgi:CBS-domain-containing membrane protein